MKKFKITSTKKAIEKQMVKIGDTIWIKAEIVAIDEVGDIKIKTEKDHAWLTEGVDRIRIQLPESKQINFGEEGRILKRVDGTVVKTTGYHPNKYYFGAYVLESDRLAKGFSAHDWNCYNPKDWTDITDTYTL